MNQTIRIEYILNFPGINIMFKINHIPAQKILHLENYVKGKQDTFKCKY